MALINEIFEKEGHRRGTVHNEVEATFVVFEKDGEAFLQIDTYGAPDRKFHKVSQSIQLGRQGRAVLRKLLDELEG